MATLFSRICKGRCRHLAATATVVLMFHASSAQTSVHGSVVNSDNQPIPGTNVFLLKAKDSSLVKGLLTSPAGRFLFEKITAGDYLVHCTVAGLKPSYQPVSVNNTAEGITLPTIKLAEKENTLSAVQVTARKPMFEQKIDRMVINVASAITYAGSTALDVLERSPGVTVDRQNNSLSVNGKDGVVVMINGKISRMPVAALMQMLSSMTSDNIERMEIITTPPANFDAEGNAGYINIVLKSNPDMGTNGSFSATAGWAMKEVANGSLNINHREKGFNLYGDYAYARRAMVQVFEFNHAVRNGGQWRQNISHSDREPVERSHAPTIGLDVDLSKRMVLGGLLSFYHRKWTMDAANTGNLLINGIPDTISKVYTYEVHTLKSSTVNLNLQYTIREGEKLSFNADYMHYLDKNPVRYRNEFFAGSGTYISGEDMMSSKTTPITFWIGTADYTRRFGKATDMEAGVKRTVSHFTNDVLIQRRASASWVKDADLTNFYDLAEDISAAYVSFSRKMSDKTSLKTGLRYEYTNSNLGSTTKKNIVDRHYGSLFPSFFLAHNFKEQQSANFSYSRRITRPTFWDLAPFVIFIDPNTFFSGNPGLQPSITEALNLGYTFRKKTLSLSYSHDNAPITNFAPRVDPATNKATLASENQKDRITWSASVSIPVTVTKWWDMQWNGSGVMQRMHGYYKGEAIAIRQNSLRLGGMQNFRLPKDVTLSVNGFYNTGVLMGIYKTRGFGTLDIGAQKKMGSRSTIRLNAANLLNTLQYRFDINEPGKNLVADGLIYFARRGIRLTWTHSFGSEKVKGKRVRLTGTEEEKTRLE
jgi:outer membrane receptor protein involved in Fe transport